MAYYHNFANEHKKSEMVSGSGLDNPLVSIIIPVFNKVEYTRQCIESLYRTLDLAGGRIEIIIVDDNSTDGTKDYLKTLPGCFRTVTNHKNIGCGKAMNRGAQASRGKYLVFLNNDTIALPGWLEELLKVIESEKHVGIVGSKLLFPDGTIQHAGVNIDSQLNPYHLFYRASNDLPEVNQYHDYQSVTGACIIIKRDLFMKVGCYDDEYANSHLDIDLCLKVKQKGYRIVYCPKTVLYHFESVSEGRNDKNYEDAKVFYKKWKGKIRPYIKRTRQRLTSIVVPCFNKESHTRLCIENIFIYSCNPFELILINNGSTDGTGDYFRDLGRKHNNIKIISNRGNSGWGPACSQGIDAADGDYILFMHNDVVVTEGWLCRMIDVGDSGNDIGVIGPVSNRAAGLQLAAGARYGSELEMHSFAGRIAVEYAHRAYYADRVQDFCMLVKKDVIKKAGGFGTSGQLREAGDFCLRAARSGFKIAVCRDVFVHHFGGRK